MGLRSKIDLSSIHRLSLSGLEQPAPVLSNIPAQLLSQLAPQDY